jgi:DNA-binding GntR family transcriptional regulator
MEIERLSTKTLRAKVYEHLKQKIITAEILPGQTLTLQSLADGFGVSLMPVREALWQLESEQIIVIESNKSIRVNTLTVQEIEEALRIRLILEATAATASCELRPDSAIPRTKRLFYVMQANIKDPRKYIIANSQFHFSIYSYAQSPMLLKIIHGLWARVGPYFVISSKEENNVKAMKWHRGMMEAFVAKNEEKMEECLRGDLEGAAKIIIPILHSVEKPDRRQGSKISTYGLNSGS